MKSFAVASIIALASVASAQLDNIPSCALSCFVAPLSSDGCSSLTDFKCHCQKGAALISTVQPCVLGACSAADQASTIAAITKTCKDAGVPIEIPGAGAASSAVASATSAAASVVSSKAVEASSKVSSAAAAISSAVASATSAAASKASSAASKASSGVAGATSAYMPGKPSPSASQFTGGAPQATKAVGLLGAAAIAMLAL